MHIDNYMKRITLTIDREVIERYNAYYFTIHTKAKKEPITQPYHESINKWMIMRRPMMNALKQRWKDFIRWYIDEQGYSNLRIEQCEIHQKIYYPSALRHDPDNSVPKFILDGLVESGMIVDDDSRHIRLLSMECLVDRNHPRTELTITIYPTEVKEEFKYGSESEENFRQCIRELYGG